MNLAGIHDPIEKQFTRGLFGTGTDASDDVYSETLYPFSSFGWSALHTLETNRYQYIDAPEPELYDVMADPEEKNNLAPAQTAVVAVFKDKLKARLQNHPFTPTQASSSELSPDALEKLRALGYVASHSPVSPEALASGLPDPKSKLWEFNAILEAGDAFQALDSATGQKLLARVQETDPNLYIVPFLLGEAALRQQQWSEAEVQLQRCLSLNPNFDSAMTGLARAIVNQGNVEDARKWVERALKFNPQNYRAWYELGFIESRTNKHAAIADYERAISIQGNFAPGRRDLGMLYFEEQKYLQAVEHLTRAAQLGVAEAQLFNFLGISYSRLNQLHKAVESYQQALKLDPDGAEAHLNLAYAYQRLNRSGEARQQYQTACKLQSTFCRYVPGSQP
jgi:tetratricopeptide (TPR) repeat protein